MRKSFTLFFLFIVFVNACRKADDPQPDQPPVNRPPAAFSVSAKQAAVDADVTLTWTKAKDPDGDPVTYAVVWKDTLAKNLTDTTYTLKNVGYTAALSGTVVATDSKKATTTAVFSFTTGVYPYSAIPDVNFEKALIGLGIDDVQDGKVLTANAQKVTQLNLSSKGIKSLQGIEVFSNLTILGFPANSLTKLDVSKNTTLTVLDCSFNQLTTLDISKNTLLAELDCSSNHLTSLDLSNNPKLTKLSCNTDAIVSPGINLTSLDVSKNTALTYLSFAGSRVGSSVDVSKNTALTYLSCSNLGTLDVSKNTALTYVYCSGLSSLDVSNNTALTYLSCGYGTLTTLDVSKNVALERLECSRTNLTALDVSKNPKLTRLYCAANQLATLNVTNATALTFLSCSENQLTALDLRSNTKLAEMFCSKNNIQTICVGSLSVVTKDWSKDASANYQVCP